MEILKNPNFDFVGKTRFFAILSATLIVAGIALVAVRGVRYGVEFSSGTQLIVRFAEAPQIDRIRDAVAPEAPGAVIQTYGDPGKNQVLLRVAGGEQDGDVDTAAQRILATLSKSYSGNRVEESSSEVVGAVVGAELRHKAVLLTVLGLLFQLIYIGFRFRGAVWGAAATIAAFHDVIITLGLLVLLQYEITLNVIAALLTLVGYSVNDTIVIFDRAREILRQRKKEPLRKTINDSINQTLSRTLISSGTTFLSVLALYLFGGEVLRGFAFCMVVGIIVGTYSTIYIATPIVVWWTTKKGGSAATQKAA